MKLSRQLVPQDFLEGLAILCKLLDTLVQLIECHLVLEERPPELRFVIDERDFWDRVGLGS